MSPSGSKHQVKAFLIGMGMLGLCTLCKRFASMSTSYASVCIKMCNKDIYIYIHIYIYQSHMLHLAFDSMYRCMFCHKCQKQMQFRVPCRKEWGVPTSGPSKELGWGAKCYSASLSAGMVFDMVSDRTWECLMCFLKGMCFFVSGKNEMMKWLHNHNGA